MNTQMRSFAADFSHYVQCRSKQPLLLGETDTGSYEYTYQQVSDLVERYLTWFQNQNLVPGDTVLALLPNSVEMFVCFLATLMGGYGFAPLPETATSREISRICRLVQPRLCLVSEAVDLANETVIAANCPVSQFIQTDNSFIWLPKMTEEPAQRGDFPRLYLLTSGSTGEPKSIVIDANILWSSGYAFMEHHGLINTQLRFWNYLPMSYLGGLFNLGLIPLITGGSLFIEGAFGAKASIQFWQQISRWDLNAVWLVPTIVRSLMSMGKRGMLKPQDSPLKYCFLGTAPIDRATKEAFEAMFEVTLLENFGLSETTFLTSETLATLDQRQERSVGEILPYIDLKLVPMTSIDEDQQTAEIRIRSPFLFLGYLDEDGSLTCPLDEEGYFPTSDLGYLSSEGTLVLTGRQRDIVKKGGFLIVLREIEIIAELHPDVYEAAAVSLPHAFYGESYALFIQPSSARTDHQALIQEIQALLRQNLVSYKWPESIQMALSDFPRTNSGKIRKHALLELLKAGVSS